MICISPLVLLFQKVCSPKPWNIGIYFSNPFLYWGSPPFLRGSKYFRVRPVSCCTGCVYFQYSVGSFRIFSVILFPHSYACAVLLQKFMGSVPTALNLIRFHWWQIIEELSGIFSLLCNVFVGSVLSPTCSGSRD